MSSCLGKRIYCGHCQEYLSKTVYHQHKRLFFDANGGWSSHRVFPQSLSKENSFKPGGSTSTSNAENDGANEEEFVVPEFLLSGASDDDNESMSDNGSDDLIVESHDDDFYLSDEEEEDEMPNNDTSEYNSIIRLYIFFLLMFQSTFHISDAALNVLFQFLSMLLKLLSKQPGMDNLASFSSKLPCSVKSAKSLYTEARDDFVRYTCCPSCSSIYEQNNSPKEKCSFIQFRNHPMVSRRQPCNTPLLKTKKTPSQKVILKPKIVYCYKSVISYLRSLLMRPGFVDKCEMWRNRKTVAGTLSDVYDGKVWADFLEYDGKPFLSLPFNYALHLNVDWYQPFEHTRHSEGAIYLTVLNLPREVRYLQENVMVIGVIPGPKEPKLNLNSFLKPFVSEMLSLWEGVVMMTERKADVLVRAALVCAGCDIPAARKVCGFVGHNGYRGCSKCLLTFPTEEFGKKADYSNTDMSEWKPRNKTDHKKYAKAHKLCSTRAQQKSIERDQGVRYSVLNELPYFDPPRMCIVDPMHNLLLGTSKHMMEIWKGLKIIDDKDYPIIHSRLESFVTPNDIGRLPSKSKILSGFSGFTAEEWKNWTTFFSLFSLKGLLPSQHYDCWHDFVKACFLLCRRKITVAELEEAHEHLKNFFAEFVVIYGKDSCTINLHLHGHLKECVEDYGPVYSFWLFAFERLNGILGSYHTNNRNISVQIMHNFLDSLLFSSCNWPQEYIEDFLPILEKFKYHKGSLQQSTLETTILNNSVKVEPLPPIQEHSFTSIELRYLKEVLGCDLLMLYKKTKAIKMLNFIIGSKDSRYPKSSFVLTKTSDESSSSLSEIHYFAECTVSSTKSHWIAAVTTYMEHPCKSWFGFPVEVWTITPRTPSSKTFIPINAIKSRVVYSKSKVHFDGPIGEETVYVIVPLQAM